MSNHELLTLIHKELQDLRKANAREHSELAKEIVGLKLKQVMITVLLALSVSGGANALMNFIK